VALPANVSGNAFNADNEMTAFNGSVLSYDPNGNLTADATNTYTWDARNHLTGISGGVAATFVYDAMGRRASKTIGGTTTQFLYDRLNPVQKLSAGNPPARPLFQTLSLFTRYHQRRYRSPGPHPPLLPTQRTSAGAIYSRHLRLRTLARF